jgi:hypothetical protein
VEEVKALIKFKANVNVTGVQVSNKKHKHCLSANWIFNKNVSMYALEIIFEEVQV